MANHRYFTHEQLQASHALVHAIVNHAPNGIITFDALGVIHSFNPKAEHIFDYTAAEMIGKNVGMLIAEPVEDIVPNNSNKFITHARFYHQIPAPRWLFHPSVRECDGLKKGNKPIPIEFTVTDMCIGDEPYFLGFIHDLTGRKQRDAQLEYISSHDQVTGLINYNEFISRVNEAAGNNKPFILFYLELDRFQPINEVLGHGTGDQVLLEVGRRLISRCDAAVQIAHISGSAFALLWPNPTGVIQPVDIARSLHACLASPLKLKHFSLDTEASVGIVCYPGHGQHAEDLLRYAQIAMQSARQRQVMVTVYDHDMEQYQLEHLTLASELRHAIKANDLIIYYQPKVDIFSRKVVAAEALVRWQHPEKGLVQPDLFIPMAEQTGIIHPFTAWLIDEAVSQIRQWQDKGIHLVVAINLAPRNLLEADLPQRLIHALNHWHIRPASLMLEITERGLIAEPQRALAILGRIHDLGMSISIDDFGTGYSSLEYLKDLPIDELKIDQSFIGAMHRDETSLTIVKMVIQMAHSLGLEVTAEGVESGQDWHELELTGCDRIQGYYTGKPMPPEEFEQWLVESPWRRH